MREITILLLVLGFMMYGLYNFFDKHITFDFHWGNNSRIARPKDYRYSMSLRDPDGRELGRSKAYGTAGQTADGVLFKNAEDGKIYEYTENGRVRVYRGVK